MASRNRFLMPFLLSLYFFFLIIRPSSGANRMYENQSLSGDQTIVSKHRNFELGFFKPGNSSKYYIGIWYRKLLTNPPTVAWVANREISISDKFSSELKIINGNLVLLNESKALVWSTNLTSTATNSVVAVLLDSGNLVLRSRSVSNSMETIWQSFDNPTHMFLPGGKLGYNKRTQTFQRITSWKNSEDPATGPYSVELQPNGSQFLMKWKGSEEYWRSGDWNGKFFNLLPEMKLNDIFNISLFNFVSNENESYFRFNDNPAFTSRLSIDVTGKMQMLSWLESSKAWRLYWAQPNKQCDIYAYCGDFTVCNQNALPFCNCLTGFRPKSQNDWDLDDHSGGCVRDTNLTCPSNGTSSDEKDGFLRSSHMQLPKDHFWSIAIESEEGCKSACSNNCSCSAYAYDGADGCRIWNDNLLNLRQLPDDDANGKTIFVKVASSDMPVPDHPRKKHDSMISKGVVVGPVVVALILLGVTFIVAWTRHRRSIRTIKTTGGSVLAFQYRDLRRATTNFSEKLGGGAFGSVYKGTLPDSTVIAVKKLESVGQGEKQFRTEVSTIGTIQHVNLVRLWGFCSEGEYKMLVYDYMPNGSLDSHLFCKKDDKLLDWKTRYGIALGVARGLVYLHEKCRDCIIHCDIKPENILLDSDFCPKVADFGLAKLVGRDFSRVLTTVRGTKGYLAPEWLSGVAITAKADVYSFGMMLFELVSGRRNREQDEENGNKAKFFPSWAAKVAIDENEDILSLLDEKLEGNGDEEEVTRICRVACWCVQDEESVRPSMSNVVQILEGFTDVTKPPVPRFLNSIADSLPKPVVFFTELSSSKSSQWQVPASA